MMISLFIHSCSKFVMHVGLLDRKLAGGTGVHVQTTKTIFLFEKSKRIMIWPHSTTYKFLPKNGALDGPLVHVETEDDRSASRGHKVNKWEVRLEEKQEIIWKPKSSSLSTGIMTSVIRGSPLYLSRPQ